MNDGISPTPASREQAEQQDSSHFAANGDEAKSLQPLLDALHPAIVEALSEYQCQHTRTDDGGGMPLADVLTPEGDTNVARGLQELELLADAIWDNVTTALGNRTPARQEDRSDGGSHGNS